jgi:shikimate kinase
VALVGFMGAGKSAVGRQLAAALALPFIDTDELVVAAAGPIPEIFEERGEQGFRALEAEIVTAAIADAEERPCVLALGGGAVLSAEVRAALRHLARVVWLTAPASVLWSRVAAAGTAARPLAGEEETFRALLAVREPLYREVATRSVDTDGRSAAAVADEIAASVADPSSEETEDPGTGSAEPARAPGPATEGRAR